MNVRERLRDVQEQLKARGVVDVKFAWNYESLKTRSKDQVCEDVTLALQAYLDGKCTPTKMYDRPS